MTTFDEQFSELPKRDLERRARSMAILRAEGVPVNEWLPILELEEQVELPSKEEVAMRAAATLLVALKGHDMPDDRVEKVSSEYGLYDWFSPKELEFIRNPSPQKREREIQTWRYEAANALFWTLGFVGRLDGPRGLVDPEEIARLVLHNTREQYAAKANLRSKSEILDQADLIYRYRWALVDARVKGREPPAGLDPDVAMERHQAFNWLIEHGDTDWDEISLDT